MLRMYKVFFLIALILVILRIFFPGSMSYVFEMDGIRVGNPSNIITKILKHPNTWNQRLVDRVNNAYNWVFFILTFFFSLIILHLIGEIPSFKSLTFFISAPGDAIYVSSFIAIFFSFFVMMFVFGANLFFSFDLPPLYPVLIILLLLIGLVIGFEIEITGNLILDAFIIATGSGLISFFFTLGLKASFLAKFSNFSLIAYLLILGGSFVVFRTVFWALTR